MPTLRAALFYFALVFGAGFVLGSIRVSFLLPLVGERTAELMEFPLMFLVLRQASRFVVQRYRPTNRHALAIGCIAAALLFLFEVGLVAPLRGLTPQQAILDRDPLTGAIYYALQIVFALFPLYWVYRGRLR